MFEEFFRDCPIKDMERVSKKRVNADIAAVRTLIKQENAMYVNKTSKISVKKRFAAVAAGIAAAMALTVTASAVSGFDFLGMVRSWFGTADETDFSEKLTEIEVKSFSNTFSNLDFEFLGAVSDDNFTAVFVEITRNDGGVIDIAEKSEIVTYNGELRDIKIKPYLSIPSTRTIIEEYVNYPNGRVVLENNIYGIKNFVIDDNDPLDNKVTFAFCFNTENIASEGEETADIDLFIDEIMRYDEFVKGVSVTGDGRECIDVGNVLTETFNGELKATFTVLLKSGETRAVKPDIQVDMTVTPMKAQSAAELINKSHPFTLKSLSVTSSSLCYELEGKAMDGNDKHAIYIWEDLVKVNLKNGDSITVNALKPYTLQYYNGGVRNISYYPENENVWYEKDTFMLGKVIDVNDVVSVEIGGQTIKL